MRATRADLSGRAFAHGLYGLPQDAERAREWYAKIEMSAIDDLNTFGKETAAAWLRKETAAKWNPAGDLSLRYADRSGRDAC